MLMVSAAEAALVALVDTLKETLKETLRETQVATAVDPRLGTIQVTHDSAQQLRRR